MYSIVLVIMKNLKKEIFCLRQDSNSQPSNKLQKVCLHPKFSLSAVDSACQNKTKHFFSGQAELIFLWRDILGPRVQMAWRRRRRNLFSIFYIVSSEHFTMKVCNFYNTIVKHNSFTVFHFSSVFKCLFVIVNIKLNIYMQNWGTRISLK